MKQWGEFQGRIEDGRLLAGRGLYVADIAVDGLTHAVVVRAQVASASVTAIDIEAALAAPVCLPSIRPRFGGRRAARLPLWRKFAARGRHGKAHQAQRPILVRDRIRAVGEPVAFVVAETLEAATAAAELRRDRDAGSSRYRKL